MMRYQISNKNRHGRRAFTMVEILTAVAITTLIVFALVSMFNTTTKALLMGIKQKDVWVSARATFDMVSADVQKVSTGGYATIGVDSEVRVSMVAFGSLLPDSTWTFGRGTNTVTVENRLQDFYLLSKEGSRWELDIYRIIRENPGVGVGTLYRFHTNYSTYNQLSTENLPIDYSPVSPQANSNPFKWTNADFVKNASRMVDGVIHMELAAFDNNGRRFLRTSSNPEYAVTAFSFEFGGEALPATVDFEFFVLEPERINEFRAQSGDIAKRLYLEKHSGNVQMFWTRIPIRKDVPELQ